MISSGNKGFARHVDDTLIRFATERLKYSSDSFQSRFISYLHMCHSGDSLQTFLRTASTLAKANMRIHRFSRNPLYQRETVSIFFVMTMVLMGFFFLTECNQCELGLVLIAGSLVQTIEILRQLSRNFCKNDVQFYIYKELKHIIDKELEQLHE